ncbi:hypothetical protein [Pseudomonas sp. RIT623]|nr:hypothetical protein [Pseudomonas sp. RIT623]
MLRIDFSKPASERFSYVAADQVVPLGDQPLPSDGTLKTRTTSTPPPG